MTQMELMFGFFGLHFFPQSKFIGKKRHSLSIAVICACANRWVMNKYGGGQEIRMLKSDIRNKY